MVPSSKKTQQHLHHKEGLPKESAAIIKNHIPKNKFGVERLNSYLHTHCYGLNCTPPES